MDHKHVWVYMGGCILMVGVKHSFFEALDQVTVGKSRLKFRMRVSPRHPTECFIGGLRVSVLVVYL